VEGLILWIEDTCLPQVVSHGFERYAKVWTGYDIADMLMNDLRVTSSTLPAIEARLVAALSANSCNQPARLLSPANEILLERLFRIIHNLIANNQQYSADYRLVLQRTLHHTKTRGLFLPLIRTLFLSSLFLSCS
jgi:hypothetical protein